MRAEKCLLEKGSSGAICSDDVHYRDGDDAHWKTNPYSIVIEEVEVNSASKLELTLAAGGGTAIRLKAGAAR